MSRVIVIGAGAMGLAAAYHALKRGHQVTVLEAAPEAGGMAAHFDLGGLSIEQAIHTPECGAPLVVLGAPLTIDADQFKTATGDVESSLRLICDRVHAYGDVPVGKR